MAAIAGHN